MQGYDDAVPRDPTIGDDWSPGAHRAEGRFAGLRRRLGRVGGLLLAVPMLALLAAGAPARATSIDIGYIAFDVTDPGSTSEFDIVNVTGANSSALGDPSFPVTTSETLSSLKLVINFSDGSTLTESPLSHYFTLDSDGLSFDGGTIGIGSGIVPTGATLTGKFNVTTITGTGGLGTVTINNTFTSVISPSDPPDLVDGDFALIVATTVSTGTTVPEPASVAMFLLGLGSLGLMRARRRPQDGAKRRRIGLLAAPLLIGSLVLGSAVAFATSPVTSVGLTTLTAPSAGVAGVTFVNLTTATLPTGTILPGSLNVMMAPTCGVGAGSPVSGELTTTASSIKALAPTHSKRISFEIPAAALQLTYYVWITGQTTTGTQFASTNCSIVVVTHTNATLNACIPSSSMAALVFGKNVTAYVPDGSWDYGTTGIQVVPLEVGSGTLPGASAITTAHTVNACASNSATGQTVCTANNTDVYLITGSTLNTTLTSGATSTTSFSGGGCTNCGVAVNAAANTAYIEEGSSSGSGQAIQELNLNSNTFAAPYVMFNHALSENISVDPGRGLILSPGEDDIYDLIQFNASGVIGSAPELGNAPTGISGDFDSAAEDCTTGIALSSQEFTGNLFITDLTQLSVTTAATPTSAGVWTAPGQSVNFPEFDDFSAGTSGISVAPGSSHLGIVTGEFGGSSFGVFQLPSTSGTGTPSFVDYAQSTMPNTPDGNAFNSGTDPHTITGYTSPNSGRAYGVMASWSGGGFGTPTYVCVVDLAEFLALPRNPSTHTVATGTNLNATPTGGFGPVVSCVSATVSAP